MGVLQPVAIPGGTAFPGSPSTGQRFFRTDRGLDYYYDGTRWLTTTLYIEPLGISDNFMAFTVGGNKFRAMAALIPTYDAWLVDVISATQHSGSPMASNYWTVTLNPSARAAFVTSAATSNMWTSHVVSIGALNGLTTYEWDVLITATGAPGGLLLVMNVSYRLVG